MLWQWQCLQGGSFVKKMTRCFYFTFVSDHCCCHLTLTVAISCSIWIQSLQSIKSRTFHCLHISKILILGTHLLLCIRHWSLLTETRLTVTSLLQSKVLSWRWHLCSSHYSIGSVVLIYVWTKFPIFDLPPFYNEMVINDTFMFSYVKPWIFISCHWSLHLYIAFSHFISICLTTLTLRETSYCIIPSVDKILLSWMC